ncbi:MAG TPA: RIP metalloprotease RseP [Flavipsychrobacter sp.]|nr:RIP metalloprotease RseP [Flavipsychrobacter sp.]
MQLNTVLLISGGAVQAIQLIAALSLLILLHEFGHFFFARLFKTRVEKFYLFFDFLFPFSGLLNFSLFKKKKGDTEYGIGWFPLGGYVKIAGMVDESMDKEALAKPPEPWEYRSKKAWQRLFIMLGGIIMNVLVGIVIYAVLFGVWGEQYLPTQNAKYGIIADSTAKSIGLRNGDMITAVNGKPVAKFSKIVPNIIFEDAKSISVSRPTGNGHYTPVEVTVPFGTIRKIIKAQKNTFIQVRSPATVGAVEPGAEAGKMGLKAGDSIVAFNNIPIRFTDEFKTALDSFANKPITVIVIRHNQIAQLHGMAPEKGKHLGFEFKSFEEYLKIERIKYNPIQAIGKGFVFTFDQFANYWQQFRLIFTSKEIKPSESLGGIVSFGKLFSPVFSWSDFLQLTAFISIILAFMNLLPIPGLDGGYVIFLIYELVTRRKVSEKIMERATTVGLVLLLGLMLYANGLDIFRLFKK